MKAIAFVNKHLPFVLFNIFIALFFVLAFPQHGRSILDVINACIHPWFEPVKNLVFLLLP